MEKSIFKYILSYTKKDQIKLTLLAVVSFPLVYYSLVIPKLIIDEGIGGIGKFAIFGIELTQIGYVLVMSTLFLVMVVVNGGMKYINNVYRGVVGERLLRRFRYTLYSRILRFPLPHFKNTSAGEIVPMVTAETEPLGGFFGDSIALPVMQGGLLITYLYFIFEENVWLGIASIVLYPLQVYVIPKLQYKVNLLSKERVHTVRKLSDRIGESVMNIADIHANDTGHFERADISGRLNKIFLIRNELFRRKFFIKFLNNFLAQLTPFFFFSIGGVLVITGELTLGSLVATLAAYEKIAPPWKELLKFYQISEDIKVKYAQIIEQFGPPHMLDEKLLEDGVQPTPSLKGKIHSTRLHYAEDATTLVSGFSFEVGGDQHSAILSRDGSAVDEVTQLMARLLPPSSGSIRVGEVELHSAHESVTGQRIGYCSPSSRLFNASIRDNLYYGLKHQPLPEDDSAETPSAHHHFSKEAIATGNSTQRIDAQWVDIKLAGANDHEQFTQIVYALIECVELDDELLSLALRTTQGIDIPEQLAAQIVTMRSDLIGQINQIESGAIIEPLDANKYIHNLSVEENLLFGTPIGQQSTADFLANDSRIKEILKDSGLQQELSDIGLELAKLMVELFSDVPDDSELFSQFSFITAAELPDYQQLVTTAAAGKGAESLTDEQRESLLAVSFKLCPAQHRLQLITPAIQDKVLAARKALMKALGNDNAQIRFFDRERYNHGMSVQENILFGKIAYAKGHLQPRVTEIIRDTLKKTNLNQSIVMAGLNCPAGAAGSKLSAIVRQKLVLARTLLKQPDILIINNALSGLDGKSLARIVERIIELRRGQNLVWAFTDSSLLPKFDQVLLIEKNKLTHNDSPKALSSVIADL